jgi:glucose/mannose-6-phosphate isomerase
MAKVDNRLEIKYRKVLETIKLYPDQLLQSWNEISKIKLPDEYRNINKVVLCGMGGSALGGRIVDSFLVNRIRVPFEIFNSYNIPNYADDKTLIIVYSYSGNTEETLSCANQAITRQAKVFVITTGGKLGEVMKDHKLPGYLFEPKNNPSGQPRLGLGYAIGSILAVFSQLEIAHISNEEVAGAAEMMRTEVRRYGESVDEKENLAMSFAGKLRNKAPVMVASEHLYGVAYAVKNQLNESAKTFSVIFPIPELNHHLMEGLKNPAKLRENLHFLFFKSKLYSDRIKKRYSLTAEVIEKNGYPYSIFVTRSDKKLDQIFEVLVFGAYVVYYLSKDYRIDPMGIPWVDYFKKKLRE